MKSYIEEFLESYITDNTYNYAVMISGAWGSGKTFFVKNYINSCSEKQRFIYISLYGIKNIEDISKDIYVQVLKKNSLYAKTIGKFEGKKISVLGSVGGRVAVDLCKGKGIDIDGIKNIYKNLVDLNKYIFIFDDLERSSIEMNEVLGYINNLVEHSGIKAIIIANEPKIANEKYKEIKEKLIANTVIYEPDIEKIFKIIINKLEEKGALKNSLLNNIDILNKKENKNIRTYQFFLSKYRRAYKALSKIYKDSIDEELIKKLIDEMYDSTISYKEGCEEDSPRNLKFISKYIYLDIWDDDEVEIVTKAYIQQVKNDKSLSELNNLSCWYELEDDVIISILQNIKEEIKNNSYGINEFPRIIRLSLIITKLGFETKYFNDIVSEMKEKKHYTREAIESEFYLNDGYFSENKNENEEMSLEFRNTIETIASSFDKNSNENAAIIINQILEAENWIKELQEWLKDTALQNRRKFATVDIDKLVLKIKALNNKDIYRFRTTFDRFIFVKKDKLFLENLKSKIACLIQNEQGKVKKIALEWFREDIERKLIKSI